MPPVLPDDLRTDPRPRAETIPSRGYTDAAMAPLERAAVFRPSWPVAGHVALRDALVHGVPDDAPGPPGLRPER